MGRLSKISRGGRGSEEVVLDSGGTTERRTRAPARPDGWRHGHGCALGLACAREEGCVGLWDSVAAKERRRSPGGGCAWRGLSRLRHQQRRAMVLGAYRLGGDGCWLAQGTAKGVAAREDGAPARRVPQVVLTLNCNIVAWGYCRSTSYPSTNLIFLVLTLNCNPLLIIASCYCIVPPRRIQTASLIISSKSHIFMLGLLA